MKLITRRDLITEHVEHMRNHAWMYVPELERINADPTLEQLVAAINNKYLTQVKCDECGQEVEAYVQIGEEPADESNTAWVCQDCLEKALALIKGE